MRKNLFVVPILLSIVSLFIEQLSGTNTLRLLIVNGIDVLVLLLVLHETRVQYREAPYKIIYLRTHIFSLSFTALFLVLFLFSKFETLSWLLRSETAAPSLSAVILKNTFLVLKILTRFRRLNMLLESISLKPAQTIVISFLLVIIAGTLLLMMPFTAPGDTALPFLNALFTATSAVCVTGLIVVDTAAAYSFWGHLVILILIQIGGLGIMLLTYFSLFALRRGISREEKLLVAYMLSQDDMRSIRATTKSIILLTFAIEALGALLLYFSHPDFTAPYGGRIFAAVFHSISAFCNAGFALFSDSLEGFAGSIAVNGTIMLMIICGGLSFSVLMNLGALRKRRLSVNSMAVLSVSGVLILVGTLFFYGLEHGGVLRPIGTGRQYLAALFQSVTLRTAGFNTVSLASLSAPTYLLMCLFMFIGGASGSTAGGIKINTAATVAAFFRSRVKDTKQVLLFKRAIPEELVLRAFTIVAFGIVTVFCGTLILLATEEAPVMKIIFEAFSAFGTVGLSAGITSDLSVPGRVVIIIMMFMGRIGPLTMLAAAGSRRKGLEISYPSADISIG